jgi:hypothetical protein
MSKFDEGFRARLAGQTIHENPYTPWTKENTFWRAGWLDQDEHLRDRDEALASIGWFGTSQ